MLFRSYKIKYDEFKNQIGGTEHYYAVVPEFCNLTKDEYKNCDRQFLNLFVYDANGYTKDMKQSINTIKLEKKNILKKIENLDSPLKNHVKKFLDHGFGETIELTRFYNKYIDYKDDKINGTYVLEKDIPIVFKNPANIPITNIIRRGPGFNATTGIGLLNLIRNLIIIKKRDPKKKYILVTQDE